MNWDSNVAVMEDERRSLHYYMQDELGSPLRVLYESGRGEVYGYDEFGREISFEGRYSRQGVKQPFGYTGYRYDAVGDTYFAQAREYQPAHGRFLAEDIRRGRTAIPKTRNRYGYCWNNPVGMVDLNGMEPELPGAELVFPQLSPQKDSIGSQLSEFVKPYEVLGFDEKKKFPSPIEFLDESGSNSSVRIIEEEKVYILGITVSGGIGGYWSSGLQLVWDDERNWDIQWTRSTGVMMGGGVSLVGSFGYMRVPSVENVAGDGIELTIGGGGPFVGGATLSAAYDEKGDYIGDGILGYFGVGTPGLDVHGGATESESIKTDLKIMLKILWAVCTDKD